MLLLLIHYKQNHQRGVSLWKRKFLCAQERNTLWRKLTEIKYFSAYNPVRILPRQPHSCFFFFRTRKNISDCRQWGVGHEDPLWVGACLYCVLLTCVISGARVEFYCLWGAATTGRRHPEYLVTYQGDTWRHPTVGDQYTFCSRRCFFLFLSAFVDIAVYWGFIVKYVEGSFFCLLDLALCFDIYVSSTYFFF